MTTYHDDAPCTTSELDLTPPRHACTTSELDPRTRTQTQPRDNRHRPQPLPKPTPAALITTCKDVYPAPACDRNKRPPTFDHSPRPRLRPHNRPPILTNAPRLHPTSRQHPLSTPTPHLLTDHNCTPPGRQPLTTHPEPNHRLVCLPCGTARATAIGYTPDQ